jgi:methyl-accepting chemotaxis protein
MKIRFDLKGKLTFLLLGTGLLPLVLLALIGTGTMQSTLAILSTNNIDSIRQMKQRYVEEFFRQKLTQLTLASENRAIIDDFVSAEAEFKSNGYKHAAGAVSRHAAAKSRLERQKSASGFYDIACINKDGFVVLSANWGSDIGASFKQPPYSSGPALAGFTAGLKGINMQDFFIYPACSDPVLIICAPMHDKGTTVGVIAAFVSDLEINNLVQEADIFRESTASSGYTEIGAYIGEIYLIGQDKMMRSNSFIDPENHSVKSAFSGGLKKNGVDTRPAREAADYMRSATEEATSYTGRHVIASYSPLSIPFLKWSIIAELDRESAYAPLKSIQSGFLLIMLLSTAAIIVVSFLVSASLSAPLQRVISDISTSARELEVASEKFESSSNSLDSSAAEQAASLEQTASSIDQISGMVQQTAENTKHADKKAMEAIETLNNGTESISRALDTINEIKKSTDETAEILATINELSFQTNMLAVNASIEATRAGEAGRGFAAVAEEIRNLAKSSSDSSRNTHKLVQNMQGNVEKGVIKSREVITSLTGIEKAIKSLAEITGGISAAADEQSKAIEQVRLTSLDMEKVVGQVAQNASETNEESRQLSKQAKLLSEMVKELSKVAGGTEYSVSSLMEAVKKSAAAAFSSKKNAAQNDGGKTTGVKK